MPPSIPIAGAPSATVNAGVYGGPKISFSARALVSGNENSVYDATQPSSVKNFDSVEASGSARLVVSRVIGASVSAGTTEGPRFVSNIGASWAMGSGGPVARANQKSKPDSDCLGR